MSDSLCQRLLVLGAVLFPLACSRIPPGRSAVDSVRIIHANEVSGEDLESKIATQASTRFLFLFQGLAYDYNVYDEAVLQRDLARIERVYRSKGYFDAHARVAHVQQVKKDHVRIEIVVEEGRAVLNRNIVLVGLEAAPNDITKAAAIAARSKLVKGAPFNEDKFKEAKEAVQRALTDRGYAYATVDTDAEVDIGEHVADYGFKVVLGPRAVFGPITIVGLGTGTGPGNEPLPEPPLRRAIDIREGAQYSTAAIDSATQALLDLEVFSSVQIVPSLSVPPPGDHVVPLTVKVEPTRLHQITLGGGIEIDEIKTDLHLVAGWENHNLFGGLRDFSASFKPGVVLYPLRIDNFNGPVKPLPEERLRLGLKQPGFIEARTTGFVRPEFNIFPLLVQRDPDPSLPVVGYREGKIPIGVERTFWNTLYVALDYTFQVENPFSYVQNLDPALSTVILSFPELVTHIDLRNDSVRPHEGIYLANTIQVAGLGGNAADVRLQPEIRTYLPLAHGLTFATRASVGFLWASNYGSDFNNEIGKSASWAVNNPPPGTVPPGARAALERDTQVMFFRGLFSGGSTTNRGYPLLGVSPHAVVPFLNPATASQQERFSCDPQRPDFSPPQCFLPVGGFTLWELQNEVRADISGPLSGSVFCDMSDVSPHATDFRFSHLHLSCGIGIAYDTPVGPIRADLGYRIPPLQILGYNNEWEAFEADRTNGWQPRIFGQPLALAIGIGQAY